MRNTFSFLDSSVTWLFNIPLAIIVEICLGVANSLNKRLGGVDSDLQLSFIINNLI